MQEKIPPKSGITRLKAASKQCAHPSLGRQLAIYYGRHPGSGRVGALLFLTGLAALAPLIYSLWRANYLYTHYGPVATEFWSPPWMVVTALAIVCSLLLAVYQLYLVRRWVAVHDNGIRLRLGFSSTRSLLWSNITGISSITIQERFLHLPLRTYQRATLFLSKGNPVHLKDPMQNLPSLIAHIKRELYLRLLPQLRAEFERGKWLSFGPIAINRRGIRISNERQPGGSAKATPWEGIRKIHIESGYLQIDMQKQRTNRISISKIPNFEILFELIQQGAQV